ncbi:hypothetical protein GALMADRAFT_243928 [Galerina marginata CBS 339.88]|uniref:Uncharacterized protein n=1 Tax=Galerina marginata (strain CBS 339.88) TaxID=685588 RepID=A0A067T5T4_GALM3|nr:hypothetical protein GALMADRAFT_243928 [Galerina marginata CBS 339.88]
MNPYDFTFHAVRMYIGHYGRFQSSTRRFKDTINGIERGGMVQEEMNKFCLSEGYFSWEYVVEGPVGARGT